MVNCRSVKNKIIELAALIETTKPHVVLGSESWLDDTINDNEIFPTCYTVYRKDRNAHGGGVFILIHNTISSFLVDVEAGSTEIVCCKVLLNNGSSVAFVSFYRSPSTRAPQPLLNLNNVLLTLQTTYIVLAGDFNLPDVIWQQLTPVLVNSSLLYTTFREMINAHSLLQFVQKPT